MYVVRKELRARVRKRFLCKDQLGVGWDFIRGSDIHTGHTGSPAPLLLHSTQHGMARLGWGAELEQEAAKYFMSG